MVDTLKVPPKRRLFPHQLDALEFADDNPHTALFMEMRLGKTMVTIRSLLESFPESRRRILVLGPNSVLGTWRRELVAERERDYVHLEGTREKRLAGLGEAHKWTLSNRECFRSIPEIADTHWDAVVLDESTFLKDPRTQVSKFFAKHFRDVPRRMILTGMPNPEHTLDFFQQFKFLMGGMVRCGNYYDFRKRYFAIPEYGYKWRAVDMAEGRIMEWVGEHAFILSRKQAGIALPVVRERREIVLPPAVRKAYDEAEEDFALSWAGRTVKQTKHRVALYSWLRQFASGWLDKKLVWQAKLRELLTLLTSELARQQVVVWFDFNHELFEAALRLRKMGFKCGCIYGDIPPRRRRFLIRKFRRGKLDLLLIQFKCASFGEDLSVSSTSVYFSTTPSRELRSHSEDRIFHPKKKESLLCVDIVALDTVQEDILDLLEDKERESVTARSIALRVRARREGKRRR